MTDLTGGDAYLIATSRDVQTAASAAVVLHQDGELKNAAVASTAASLREDGMLVDVIAKTIPLMAANKNVILEPERVTVLAHVIAQSLGIGERKAHSSRVIARALDAECAAQVLRSIWQGQGFRDLDDAQMAVWGKAWIDALGPDGLPTEFRWPDMFDFLCDHLELTSKSRKRFDADSGKHRALYFIGRTVDHPYASAFPLMLCRTLPYTPGGPVPNGRYIKTFADGARGTYWWRDGKTHRDTTEGPAVQVTRDGETVMEVYAEKGVFHRDPADGPAYLSVEQGELILEYWVRGQKIETSEIEEPCHG